MLDCSHKMAFTVFFQSAYPVQLFIAAHYKTEAPGLSCLERLLPTWRPLLFINSILTSQTQNFSKILLKINFKLSMYLLQSIFWISSILSLLISGLLLNPCFLLLSNSYICLTYIYIYICMYNYIHTGQCCVKSLLDSSYCLFSCPFSLSALLTLLFSKLIYKKLSLPDYSP